MLRYWEVVDDNGVILAAGLGGSIKHLPDQDEEEEKIDAKLPTEPSTPVGRCPVLPS